MNSKDDNKQHRKDLISFLLKFKHNEVDKWEIIEESVDKHVETFADNCEVFRLQLTENTSDVKDLAKQFLKTSAELYYKINKKDETAIVFKDHTKWNKFCFYFPVDFKTTLSRKLGVVRLDTAKEYDMKITYYESIMIWWNVKKVLKEFYKQRQNKMYNEMFDAL